MKKIKFSITIVFFFLVTIFLLNFKRINHPPEEREPLITRLIQTLSIPSYKGPFWVEDEILVKFKPTLSDNQITTTISSYKSEKVKRIPKINVYQLKIPSGYSVKEMVSIFQANPDVEFAEPNYIAYLTIAPNDPLFQYQYALENDGQEIGSGGPTGTPGADIKAPEAWKEEKGQETVIIAIVDTGIDLNHPDLKNKIYSSGYDFVNNDSQAQDDHGHGTHCAGIAAAETNNNDGIAGVAWDCQLLPVKVMDKNGTGKVSWVSNGIIWAVDQEAQIISLSLGSEYPSNTLKTALNYAYSKNAVIVAAAGNEGGAVLYPAAYDEYCLAVAATDYNDQRATFLNTEIFESNFGPEVDVAAPGVRILSTYPVDLTPAGYLPYAYSWGTSMSTPHVAGMTILIKSLKPWLKNYQIMDIIRYSADDINSDQYPGKDNYLGYGRINMKKAIVPIELK
ncbi:MAG: S8 family peptidase [Candidatus Aminicenantia bacterium]